MTKLPGLPAAVTCLLATVLAASLPGAPTVATVEADVLPPTVTVPTFAPRTGATVTATAVPFTVSWRGSDAGSGIASYRLQRSVDGGSWETVALPGATSRSVVTGLRPPHEYRFRVLARDRAGNTSPWATSLTFRVRRVSEQTSMLTWTGSWRRVSGSGFLGDHARRSGAAGSTATFTFIGSQVAWFGTRSPNRGSAAVYLDGVRVATVDLHRARTAYRRIVFRHSWPASGAHTLRIRVLGTAGHPYVDVDGLVFVDPPATDPVLVGAGDVATCGRSAQSRTAALLDGIAGRVFVAGDAAYPNGSAKEFRECFGPTWGRWKLRTSPAPGNHEYNTPGAAPYFSYFGSRAGTSGQGWYAYDLGTWRIYSLNANCSIVGCAPGSDQERWLRADLAANPRACVAAVWHQPLFSSGQHGNDPAVRPLWEALQDAGADLVVNGHDHDYERFVPQTAAGVAAPDGIREFVVGTGGAALRPFATIRANSARRDASTYGVLKLTLGDGGYDWRFVPVAGQSFTDSGSADCH